MRLKENLPSRRSYPRKQKSGLLRKGYHGRGKGPSMKEDLKQGQPVLFGPGYKMIKKLNQLIIRVSLHLGNQKCSKTMVIEQSITRPQDPGHRLMLTALAVPVAVEVPVVVLSTRLTRKQTAWIMKSCGKTLLLGSK